MKKMVWSLIAACGSGVACAQSSVTIYGVLDAAVEHVTNVGPSAANSGGGLTQVPTLTGAQPSRIGFRGQEDLGGGLKAVFALENGLSLDSGMTGQGGRLFGRQAYVGLASDWGRLTIGRNYSMLFWSLLDAPIMGPSAHGFGVFDSYLLNARVDNSISYLGVFGNLTVGALYSLGRDTVNAGPSPAGTNCAGENPADPQACRSWSAMVKYANTNWGALISYDHNNGGAGAFGGLVRSDLSDRRTVVNGYYKAQEIKFSAGWIARDNEAAAKPRSDIFSLGASTPITPLLELQAEGFRHRVRDTSNKSTLLVVRGVYYLSKSTSVYMSAAHMRNDGAAAMPVSIGSTGLNPLAGKSQTGVIAGVTKWF